LILFFELIPSLFVPIFIFFARILDVSLGTLRIMFVSKGLRGKATLLGFVEVFIWIIVVAQIFQNLDNWLNYLAYAGGFAAGTFMGMYIEEKMKMGVQIIRIIVGEKSEYLRNKLLDAGFRVTAVQGDGKYGPVKVLFTVIKRKRWKELHDVLKSNVPDAFYSVEDVRQVSDPTGEMIASNQDTITKILKLKKGI